MPYADVNDTRMWKSIPHAELLLINHAPHEVQYSHTWLVGPQVLDFLARNPGPV